MKKYLANTTGFRDVDTARHDNTVDMLATQKARTAKSRYALAGKSHKP
jgi:hypothetical protein